MLYSIDRLDLSRLCRSTRLGWKSIDSIDRLDRFQGLVHGSAMRSLSLVMSECSVSGRGQGHVSNFYIVDLENFVTASRRYTGDIHNSTVVGLFMTPVRQWKRLASVMVESTCLLHIGPPYTSKFITSICSGLVVQVVSAQLRGIWQDVNWHDASRGPSAIAELLVLPRDAVHPRY